MREQVCKHSEAIKEWQSWVWDHCSAVPITPEGKAELRDEDQTGVLASFTKTLPLSSSFHMYKRTRLLDSGQITKLFYMTNTPMLYIHLIQTCQHLKRNRKHFPYLLLTSESLLPIKICFIWCKCICNLVNIVTKYLGKLITQYLICRSHF